MSWKKVIIGNCCCYPCFFLILFHWMVSTGVGRELEQIELEAGDLQASEELEKTPGVDTAASNSLPDDWSIYKDFWKWRLAEVPEFATALGVSDNDDKLEVFTFEAFKKRKQHCDRLISVIDQLHTRGRHGGQQLLQPQQLHQSASADATSMEVLRQDLETFADGYQWMLYSSVNPVNSFEGIQRDFTFWLDSMKFEREENFKSYVNRLRALATQIHEQINLMREAIRLQRTNHKNSMLQVQHDLKWTDHIDVHRSPFFKPFNDSLEFIGISANKIEKIRTEGASVIQDHVLPAYKKLSHFISHDYLPHTRKHPGIGSLQDGPAYYTACLRWYLSIDVSPAALHSSARETAKEIMDKIDQIRQRVKYSGKLEDFIKHCNRANKFFYRTEEEIMQEYTDLVKNTIPEKLSQLFYPSPTSPPEVHPMQFDGPNTGVLMPGNEESGIPAIFFINVQDPFKHPKWQILITALQESLPGRHLQASYVQNQTFPEFRKWREQRKMFSIPFQFPFHSAYIEGWSLYAVTLGYDLDLLSDPYNTFGQLYSELCKICEIVVDTGIHALGWTIDESVEYVARMTGASRSKAELDVDRIITFPGQAIAPEFGHLQIKFLRRKAQLLLGDRFDIREFHHQVLKLGPVPLNILESEINKWLGYTPSRNSSTRGQRTIKQATLFFVLFLLLTSNVLL